jgi:hypothetical protein
MQDSNHDRRGYTDEEIQRGLQDAVADRDVRARGIVVAGISVLFLVVVSFAVPAALFVFFSSQDASPDASARAQVPLPPEPRLQTNEYGEWEAIRTTQLQMLESYAYTNRQRGTARIPVRDAMDILVERGLPVAAGREAFPIDRQGFAEEEAAEWASGQSVQSGR